MGADLRSDQAPMPSSLVAIFDIRREMHAKIRAKQRYGLILDSDLKRRILSEIRRTQRFLKKRGKDEASPEMKAQIISKERTRQIWDISLDGRVLRVVYSHIDHIIVTFLPSPNCGEYRD